MIQNEFLAGAPPRNALRELTALPAPYLVEMGLAATPQNPPRISPFAFRPFESQAAALAVDDSCSLGDQRPLSVP